MEQLTGKYACSTVITNSEQNVEVLARGENELQEKMI